jgi:hypothetical protein
MASIGNPEIMLVDVRPFNHPILFIRSHLVAEQVSKQTKLMPYSVGKSPTMEFVTPITGPNSIITLSVSDAQSFPHKIRCSQCSRDTSGRTCASVSTPVSPLSTSSPFCP